MPTIATGEMTLSEDDILIALMYLDNMSRPDLVFQSKANRDAVWSRLGKNERRKFRKTSIRNQLFDPLYTFEGRNLEDKGLGNDYRHYFAALYEIKKETIF